MDFLKAAFRFLILGLLRYIITLGLSVGIAIYFVSGQKFPPDLNNIEQFIDGIKNISTLSTHNNHQQNQKKLPSSNLKSQMPNQEDPFQNTEQNTEANSISNETSNSPDRVIKDIENYYHQKKLVAKELSQIPEKIMDPHFQSESSLSPQGISKAKNKMRIPDSLEELEISSPSISEINNTSPQNSNRLSEGQIANIYTLIEETKRENQRLRSELQILAGQMETLKKDFEGLTKPHTKNTNE